jgi:ribosomal protein S18 acetylase RimI-like enzyme
MSPDPLLEPGRTIVRVSTAPSTLTIRPLTPSDGEAWWDLRLPALRDHPGAFGSDYDEMRVRPLEERLREFTARCTGHERTVIGAFEGDALVGVVGCFREEASKVRHKAGIWGMYVAPHVRSRGAGRALVEAAMVAARSWSGVEEVRLTVASDNESAKRLYRACGFETYATEPRALKLPDRYVDEDYMLRRI